jgi:hypothetical protein
MNYLWVILQTFQEWQVPVADSYRLMGYAESHDEERLMYKTCTVTIQILRMT